MSVRSVFCRGDDERGFTLPELLVATTIVIVLLVLAALVVSSNPEENVRRDAQRRLDLAQLAQGLNAYYAAYDRLPSQITTEELFIGSGEGEADLCAELQKVGVADVPFDPLSESLGQAKSCSAGDYITGYSIQKQNNKVTLRATLTETGSQIEIVKMY